MARTYWKAAFSDLPRSQLTKSFTKLRSTLPQLPYLLKAIKLVWQAAGYWTVVWAVLLILQGILPAVQIYLVKTAINSFVAVVNNDVRPTDLTAAFTDIGILVALILSGSAITSFSTWVRSLQSELTEDYLTSLIHNQASSLDLAFFESPVKLQSPASR